MLGEGGLFLGFRFGLGLRGFVLVLGFGFWVFLEALFHSQDKALERDSCYEKGMKTTKGRARRVGGAITG